MPNNANSTDAKKTARLISGVRRQIHILKGVPMEQVELKDFIKTTLIEIAEAL